MVLDTSADPGRGQSEEPHQVVVTWGHPHLQTRTPELRGDGLVGSSDPGEQTGGIWAETRLGSQALCRPAVARGELKPKCGWKLLRVAAGRWAHSPVAGQARHGSPLLTPAPGAAVIKSYFTEEDAGSKRR